MLSLDGQAVGTGEVDTYPSAGKIIDFLPQVPTGDHRMTKEFEARPGHLKKEWHSGKGKLAQRRE